MGAAPEAWEWDPMQPASTPLGTFRRTAGPVEGTMAADALDEFSTVAAAVSAAAVSVAAVPAVIIVCFPACEGSADALLIVAPIRLLVGVGVTSVLFSLQFL